MSYNIKTMVQNGSDYNIFTYSKPMKKRIKEKKNDNGKDTEGDTCSFWTRAEADLRLNG